MDTPSDESDATGVAQPPPLPNPLAYHNLMNAEPTYENTDGVLEFLVQEIANPEQSPIQSAERLIQLMLLLQSETEDHQVVFIEKIIGYAYHFTRHGRTQLKAYIEAMKQPTKE